MRRFDAVLSMGFALVLMDSCSGPTRTADAQSTHVRRSATSSAELRGIFREQHYSLARVRQTGTVPPIFATGVPSDLGAATVSDHEHLFIRVALPAILASNSSIESDREELARLTSRSADQPLSRIEANRLEELANRYAATTAKITVLMQRVDAIPVSLALARAIHESDWGRARYAAEGNALFGQLAPAFGSSHSIPGGTPGVLLAAFATVRAAAVAQAHEVNTGAACKGMRQARARLRAAGRRPTGLTLASASTGVDPKCPASSETLKSIIRIHRLDDFDAVTLEGGRRPIIVDVRTGDSTDEP